MVVNGNINLKRFGDFYTGLVSDHVDKSGKELPMVLSLHRGINKFDFSPIGSVTQHSGHEEQLYEVVLVNSLDIRHFVVCTADTEFGTMCFKKDQDNYPRPGPMFYRFVKPQYLNKSTICVDETGRTCQVVSVEKTNQKGPLYEVHVKHNNNFFYNGMLVR